MPGFLGFDFLDNILRGNRSVTIEFSSCGKAPAGRASEVVLVVLVLHGDPASTVGIEGDGTTEWDQSARTGFLM